MQWKIDPSHSSLTFGVRHMMVSTVRGSVGGITGTVDFDPARPEKGTIEVAAEIATISTGEPKRDGHLRSADFFDAERFPAIRFISTSLRPLAGERYEVAGQLEIHGVTRPVRAEAEIAGIWDDPKMGRRIGLNAALTIDRRDWGLVWNQPIASGGLLVGEKVKIELGLAAVATQSMSKAA